MSIDAYDTLGLDVDASEEDVKKAYKRMSLQHHPDKMQSAGDGKECSGDKFNEIKDARDILASEDRKKIYDTFGCDLGEERPEMEVWNIGVSTVLQPTGGFLLKFVVARVALWLFGFSWVGYSVLLCSAFVMVLYWLDPMKLASRLDPPAWYAEYGQNALVPVLVGVVDVVIILYWILPLIVEAVLVFYLVSEVVGLASALESWKIAGGVGLGSFVLAWLLRGWWWWVLGLQVLLIIIMLAALTIAAGIMRLWIEGVQTQKGDELRKWRMSMRKERKKLVDEVTELKRKLKEQDSHERAKPTAQRRI